MAQFVGILTIVVGIVLLVGAGTTCMCESDKEDTFYAITALGFAALSALMFAASYVIAHGMKG